MKILFASDSFKGSLTSFEINELLEIAVHDIFPDAETVGIGIADGGEGTMETLVKAMNGKYKHCLVKGPLGDNVKASYGILTENRAIIEMAQASGLTLISENQKNAEETTSFGTGMLICDALNEGIRDITIAIGGSASNDGGIGCMKALGAKFLDEEGNDIQGIGKFLGEIREIDLSDLHPAVNETKFTVMCDVVNPLLGEYGATYTFGSQKGADEEMLKRLEAGMKNYSEVTMKVTGKDFSNIEGAGAAGGLGFAFMAFLNAELMSGIEAILDLIDFDNKLTGVDLVITGEGRMDNQSSFGKVPSGVGKRCKKYRIPVVAIVGGILSGYEKIYDCGIESVITTISGAMDIDKAIKNGKELYLDAARRLLRLIRCGMII